MSQHICIVTSAHPLDDVRVNSKIAASFLGRGCAVSWAGPEISFFADVTDRDDRISYHLTPPLRSKFDRLASARRVARKAREVKDVDWYYAPDPDAAEAAVKLARGSTARVLFDIHENYHGATLDRWLKGRRASLVRHYVRRRIARTAQRSDLVMGVNESVLRPYVDPRQPQISVRNCAPRWFAEMAQPQEQAASSTQAENVRTTFMHGKALPNNGCQVVLEALSCLGQQRVRGRVVMFPSAGVGAPAYMPDLASRIARLKLGDSVWLHDAVTHERMPALTALCDVGMVAYGRDLGEDSLPNRLFEYMASGIAVLAPSYAVEIKRIVETEDIGLVVDFERPAEIANAMQWFIENPKETEAMGARARTAFIERHNWDAEFDRLVAAMAAQSANPRG
jgi:glycosyltransferase involved in cell wall biosynthesis